ncbi:MAG TPA: hypothetical protein HPP56_05610, partial [Nitrospirae bacterium]|nr:hypothetical protein [Nitrospirota bacterium]
KCIIIWQDKHILGIKFVENFDTSFYIKKNLLKPKEENFLPDIPLSYLDISKYTQYDFLTPLTNLMAELESEDTNISRLKIYINNLHTVRQRIIKDEEMAEEKRKKLKKDDEPPVPQTGKNMPDLKETLLLKATSGRAIDIESANIDLAIARLGIDNVKRYSSDFVKKNLSKFEINIVGFRNYQLFNVLKTVMFKKIAPFFGYKNEYGEGSSLLSLETTAVKILTQKREKELSTYYTNPTRLYSDISRIYEQIIFGQDFLQVTKTYFDKVVGIFQNILDGYLIAHQTLNPQYMMQKNIKLILNKNKLIYGFVTYLTMLGSTFIIENDREAGVMFIKRLLRTGIEDEKVMEFINEVITDTNIIASDMGLKGSLRTMSLPITGFKLENFIPQETYYDYLINAFRKFNIHLGTRMVLRYDDDAYCHYLLNKFININHFGLDNKIFTVIPCENLGEKEIFLEDISNFDLVIFKNINKLPFMHIKSFMRLWANHDGKIIATMSGDAVPDFDSPDLYKMVKNHIVDFPSAFRSVNVHKKMIIHSLNRLKPFIHKTEFDPNPYLKDVSTSYFIISNELFYNPPFMYT